MTLLMLLLSALAGCTVFSNGKQFELDSTGTKYRFYLYQMPSWQLLALRDGCKYSDGQAREAWGRCSLTFLRNVEVETVAKVDWNHFTEGGQWDDYTDAVANVAAGGTFVDSQGISYTSRCMVGDHTSFGSYNWTWRVDSDTHCKRGQPYVVS